MSYHIPVMLEQCMEGLRIKPSGIYVDATFGGGGHSRAILERLGPQGRLLAFDTDDSAKANLPEDKRIQFIHSNYRHLLKFLRLYKALPVDGILADFGVSSHQIDTPERGFSIRYEGRLDMRMDRGNSVSAWDIINTWSREQLSEMFYKYGEISNARKLSDAIIRARQEAPVSTTTDLVEIARTCSVGKQAKYLAQVFQALRIVVNDEIAAIEEFLLQTPDALQPGGRLVILTYHSLEDRPVKHFLKTGHLQGQPEKDLYGRFYCPWKLINRKPIEATEEEIQINPRARSARLRIAERI